MCVCVWLRGGISSLRWLCMCVCERIKMFLWMTKFSPTTKLCSSICVSQMSPSWMPALNPNGIVCFCVCAGVLCVRNNIQMSNLSPETRGAPRLHNRCIHTSVLYRVYLVLFLPEWTLKHNFIYVCFAQILPLPCQHLHIASPYPKRLVSFYRPRISIPTLWVLLDILSNLDVANRAQKCMLSKLY